MIQIDYEPGSVDPARVFRAMAQLIDTLHAIDRDIVGTLGLELEPIVVLERVEAGSIRAFLRTIISAAHDDALLKLEWRPLIGQYLVRAKHKALRWLDDKTTIDSRADLTQLQEIIVAEAPELPSSGLALPAAIPPARLLEDVQALSTALEQLAPGDAVTYTANGASTPVSTGIHISSERIEELLTQATQRSETEMVLLVKKPDYLGRSRWEFKQEDHLIEASIADADWLARFRDGSILLKPGYALHALVLSEVSLGFEGQVVSTRHRITKVLGVIAGEQADQSDFFDDEV